MAATPSLRWSLPWPVVPPRLLGTAAASAVAVASLVFNQEIWPHHPQAVQWTLLALVVLVQAGGLQVMLVLWAWPAAVTGPGWLRLLLRAVVLAAIAGIALVQLAVLGIGCFVLASS
jgi:hypothetical protein